MLLLPNKCLVSLGKRSQPVLFYMCLCSARQYTPLIISIFVTMREWPVLFKLFQEGVDSTLWFYDATELYHVTLRDVYLGWYAPFISKRVD